MPSEKFTDADVLSAFDETHRRSVGKIELNAEEVAQILNEEILSEDSVTRQAVHNRLKKLVKEEKLRQHDHGRSYTYTLSEDIEKLFKVGETTTEKIKNTIANYDRPFMGTGELADELGYTSNAGVKKHLEQAVDKGIIEQAQISGYNIWYLPEIEDSNVME